MPGAFKLLYYSVLEIYDGMMVCLGIRWNIIQVFKNVCRIFYMYIFLERGEYLKKINNMLIIYVSYLYYYQWNNRPYHCKISKKNMDSCCINFANMFTCISNKLFSSR